MYLVWDCMMHKWIVIIYMEYKYITSSLYSSIVVYLGVYLKSLWRGLNRPGDIIGCASKIARAFAFACLVCSCLVLSWYINLFHIILVEQLINIYSTNGMPALTQSYSNC